jgi:hypothetical protein
MIFVFVVVIPPVLCQLPVNHLLEVFGQAKAVVKSKAFQLALYSGFNPYTDVPVLSSAFPAWCPYHI